MFKNRMFYKPYVQKPYVLQTLCYAMLCSKTVFYVQKPYVLQTLCYIQKPYVLQTLSSKTVCFTNPMLCYAMFKKRMFYKPYAMFKNCMFYKPYVPQIVRSAKTVS